MSETSSRAVGRGFDELRAVLEERTRTQVVLESEEPA